VLQFQAILDNPKVRDYHACYYWRNSLKRWLGGGQVSSVCDPILYGERHRSNHGATDEEVRAQRRCLSHEVTQMENILMHFVIMLFLI
jgi:hypothetical protein